MRDPKGKRCDPFCNDRILNILTMSPYRSPWTVYIMDEVQDKGPDIGQSRPNSAFRELPKSGKSC